MVDDGSRTLAGRYEVGELIGRGGMAEVHIGHDTRLGRTVAIKILRSDLARDPSFQNRFRREAQSAAALNHPAIVSVYDTGEDVFTEPTGVVAHVPFIVMEYVEGHTVRDILRDGHAVPIEEAVEITSGVLSALEYSHHAGIVHRDIKPANVMLTPTGAVKVMDFGIARAMADSAATMTQTQAVIGTAQYLSPEQARGETVDARSDLYSTGCLLFELLTGRPPFTGDSPVAVAYQHVREAAPIPSTFASDVPDSLDRITLKALAKERDSRYSSAAEFRSDLEAAVRGGAVGAPAVGALAAAALVATPATEATQLMAPPVATTQAMPPATSPWASTGAAVATTPGLDDEEENKRPWLLPLLIGIAVLAVAGIVALLISVLGQDPPATTVQVPAVVGLTEAEAKEQITAANLLYERGEEANDTVPSGSVIKTEPVEGTEVEPESVVKAIISTGPSTLAVPDVAGMTEQEATDALTNEGLVVSANREDEDNPNFPQGQVTKTEPASGTSVSAGSTVTLFVSTGNVLVPNVVGMTTADATAALNAAKLQVNRSPVESTNTPDTVVTQDVPADTPVKQGRVINLTIAQAPTTATIPNDLVGKTYDQAVEQLRALGLTNVRRVDDPSEEPVGNVLRTDPNAGDEVPMDQQIDIHVSKGPGGATTAPPGNDD
ncbi:Stk1 family PASTA domain-containing Ser/Thr kinase [Cellulomonas sp. Leaf334]|uniref:Stk1 family PASTA domain-containing Ser/Thr kinase n=1 Tax=Cellulomonas sp. Leaf334 TaxID=1736339 RepID=UPI0006FCFB7A|nr:Stk1 family PASTA domain-containing Ser/Thr kinase [Cellulomonas sp. Leaf334]KQR17152.1 serine/threonine protein kinase [Cellulomonas sp. Leaf334]